MSLKPELELARLAATVRALELADAHVAELVAERLRIVHRAAEAGASQEAIADVLGVSQQQVSKLIRRGSYAYGRGHHGA